MLRRLVGTTAPGHHDCSIQECKTIRELLVTDHVILNHGQVPWTTPELAPSSPNYHINGRTFQLLTYLTCIAALHGGSLMLSPVGKDPVTGRLIAYEVGRNRAVALIFFFRTPCCGGMDHQAAVTTPLGVKEDIEDVSSEMGNGVKGCTSWMKRPEL
ncbi:hypothetical protein TNCV_1837251 [Trichonephila clavipes]|nr:hypothetical protein TNCV_1837251 [Trichonephila clavipes]